MTTFELARKNCILALLPDGELERLLPDLELVAVPPRQLLQPAGALAQYAYFPISGVASMISSVEAGFTVEVATIGYEGMTGLSLFLGAENAELETIMQVPGEALRMSAKAFQPVASQPSLVRVLHLYTQALISQIAQSSACNRVHHIEKRCARWLLQSHDRARIDEFHLTQEFLGFMLGVRRASVSEVASALQAQGFIRYVRGVITVVDRKGLERAACTCYSLISRAYEMLLSAKLPAAG